MPRTHLALLGGLGLGCAAPAAGVGQPGVRGLFSVHVEPLSKEGEAPCQTVGLDRCGTPAGASWEKRTRNLSWLSERWLETDRTIELGLGPEMSRAWAGDPEIHAALVADLVAEGDAEGAAISATQAQSRVADGASRARIAIASLVAGGRASLAVHTHADLIDASGVWGSAPTGGSDHPCEAWEGAPLDTHEPSLVEAVVAEAAWSAAGLVELTGGELSGYTGHLPRGMWGKQLVVDDPDGLDPETSTPMPDVFRPISLGSAYSECLIQAVDHPPFEPYSAHPERALGEGDGPLVIPGERSVGMLGEHLDAPADSAAPAAQRRLLQLMLNWRAASLAGDAHRPWVWTFHSHLYMLNPGEPDPLVALDRETDARVGRSLRGDVEAVAGFMDRFAGGLAWQGVAAADGPVLQWALPEEIVALPAGSFSYGAAGEAPPTGFDRDAYPYLPLVGEALADSHLVCEGAMDGAEVYGLSRCQGGWTWGGDAAGYHCAEESVGVVVLVPTDGRCVDVPGGALRAAPTDASEIGPASWCGDGSLEVPAQGLIVVPAEGLGWVAETCGR